MSDFDLLKKQGNDQYKSKNFSNALEFYQKALNLASDPKIKAILYSNIANSYFQLEKYENCLENACFGIDTDISNMKNHYWKAMALGKLRKFDLAIELCERLIKRYPGNIEIKNLFINLLNENETIKIQGVYNEINLFLNDNFLNSKPESATQIISKFYKNPNIEILKNTDFTDILTKIVNFIHENRMKIAAENKIFGIFIFWISKYLEKGLIFDKENLFKIAEILNIHTEIIKDFCLKFIQKCKKIQPNLIEFLKAIFISDFLDSEKFAFICELILSQLKISIENTDILLICDLIISKLTQILLKSTTFVENYENCLDLICAIINFDKEKILKKYLCENIDFLYKSENQKKLKILIFIEICTILDIKFIFEQFGNNDFLVFFSDF